MQNLNLAESAGPIKHEVPILPPFDSDVEEVKTTPADLRMSSRR